MCGLILAVRGTVRATVITIDITGDAGLTGETQPGTDNLLMSGDSSTAAIDLKQSANHFVKGNVRAVNSGNRVFDLYLENFEYRSDLSLGAAKEVKIKITMKQNFFMVPDIAEATAFHKVSGKAAFNIAGQQILVTKNATHEVADLKELKIDKSGKPPAEDPFSEKSDPVKFTAQYPYTMYNVTYEFTLRGGAAGTDAAPGWVAVTLGEGESGGWDHGEIPAPGSAGFAIALGTFAARRRQRPRSL